MSFLDTTLAPIERPERSGRASSWSAFRVTDARERTALLREICRTDVPLTLGTSGGRHVPALLWSLDDAAARLNFSVADDGELEAWSRTPALWAAGYLGQVKLQFELNGLVVRGGTQRMLQAELPQYMVRLPRRRDVRVRRPFEEMPLLRLVHPLEPTLQLMLPMVDVGLRGCALWQHPGGLPLAPGARLPQVEILLDTQVLRTGLVVHHMSPGGGTRRPGVRLGCEWLGMGRDEAQALQRWIARGQRRRDIASLRLD